METSGVAFARHPGRGMVIRIASNMRFTGRGLWQAATWLERCYPAGATAVIEGGRLAIHVADMERPTPEDVGVLSRYFVPVTSEYSLDEPQPLFVFKRHGEVACNPDIELTTAHLAAYVQQRMAEQEFDGRWSANLTEGFLALQLGEWMAHGQVLQRVFRPKYAGTCTISGMAYAHTEEEAANYWIRLRVEAGYEPAFDLAVAQKLDLQDVRPGEPSCALGTVAGRPPLNELVSKAVTFAQALGYMPIGEFTLYLSPHDRHVRTLGPLGVVYAAAL